ncbi:MAG: stage III sporulation protein AF [Lachnospirales bacterium]
MKVITEYIKNIAVFTILTGFISIMLPDNSYKKYIYIIIGIMFCLIVIEPLKRGLK